MLSHGIGLTLRKCIRCLESISGQCCNRAVEKLEAELVHHDTANVEGATVHVSPRILSKWYNEHVTLL